MFEPKPLKRLSLCPCGYTVLHDHIPLGRVYHVDVADAQAYGMRCGGCGKKFPVTMVKVDNGKRLPAEMFEAVQ